MEKFTQFSVGRYINRCPRLIVYTILLMTCLQGKSQTNGVMACNDLVQVSLDGDCQALINPDMILEGTYSNPWTDFTVRISNVLGVVVTKPGFHTVTVTNNLTGNSCWGNISVEDKLPPVILDCPCALGNEDPECTFYCSDLDGIKSGTISVPSPTVDENCSTTSVTVTDHVTDNGCQGKVLRRTYIYKDIYGNVSPACVSYYNILPVTLADVTPPQRTVQLTCGAKTDMQSIFNYFKPSLGTAVARTYAWPTIRGQIISNDGPCNLAAAKTDSEVLACGPDCADSKKVIRTWTVLDWCSGQTVNFVQVIKATDDKAPTIVAKDLVESVDPWGCFADIIFPDPITLHDNCDSKVEYKIEGSGGIQIVFQQASKKFIALNVPKGNHQFFYKGIDCCGNVGVDTINVSVRDLTSPVAISKEFIVVSLTNGGDGNGVAKIYAQSIDNGSHDGCTGIKLEIRRDEDKCAYSGNATYNNDGHSFDGSADPNSPAYDPDNGAFVKFCCADLTGTENGVAFGKVKVWLRVWDDGDMNGIYGSAGDNYNETWSFVRVEDKLAPTLVCPKDITLECHDDYKNLDKTGRPSAFRTCGPAEVDYSDATNLNSCGTGTVRRRWFIKSNPEIFCFQNILIKPAPPATVFVTFPADITTTCKNLPGEQKPTYTGGVCNLLGHSLKSDTFFIEDGVCMKIINRYTVIDWCTYQPNNPNSNVGIWTGTQIIKVKDDEAPALICRDEMYEVNDNADADGDGNKCELKNLVLTNSADDNGDCASRWLKWIVLVDLWGDGTTDYEYTSFISPADNSFATDGNLNGIPDRYLAPTSSNQNVSITIPEDITGSMSNHKIQWKVSDGCGNITSCNSNFMVVDKKKPTPYCISLSSALMINGKVELWARDFDKGSFDNCTKAANLLFTFDKANPVLSKINIEHYFKGNGIDATKAEFDAGTAQRWVPASKSSSRQFGCSDLPQANIEMTVWDEKFNFDFCNVTLNLLDNQGACGGGNAAAISGNATFESKGINQANVHLTGASNTIVKDIQSDNSGGFNFTFNPMYVDYKLTASKGDDPLNGVSTIDLVLIQRHILGVKKFDDPLQYIASDINGDRKISATDLVELRKIILGINANFANNKSWTFIDGTSTFANPVSPWPLDEEITIAQLDKAMTGQNFIGIKMGDVNKNALANIMDRPVENRSNTTAHFIIDDIEVAKGKTYSIPVNFKDSNIKAYQFGLQTEGIEITGFEFDNLATDEYYNLKDANNALISWNTSDIKTSASGLTIKVLATKDGFISNMLNVSETLIPITIAKGEELEEADLNLVFRKLTKDENTSFEVYQNEPNPFKESTTISFNLPLSQKAKLSIFDVTGRLLHTEVKDGHKGVNTFNVNMNLLNNTGVMYYQIESGEFTATKSMIGLK